MTPVCAVHDGRAGNARQAMALAEALSVGAAGAAAQAAAGPHVGRAPEHVLHPRAPWRWLSPRRLPAAHRAFGDATRQWLRAPPRVVVGCGRQAALATRLAGERGARAVQVLDPRIDPAHWDLVVAPRHDGLTGANVITCLGSLHPVNDDWLLRAVSAFPDLALLPTPHTVLLVGGPGRNAPLSTTAFRRLLDRLAAVARAEGGSFSAIASRRTPPAWRALLGAVDARLPGLRWRDTGDGANPFAGFLAYADRIVCTPDSVNMLSEAAATHAPLFIATPAAVTGRKRDFIDALLGSGRARPDDGALDAFDVEPLRETARVAALVGQRLGLR